MGGCRCSYRNCTLRTDGVTHMFHYPVFDKVRCHQWLTNAHKLNFLNLKVSQLKNRVVCQHHFRDENFMNFKKDKLTFDAVPTVDGPYCDTSQFDEQNNVEDFAKEFLISQDDIENECLTLKEKRANFSVKYGDFLTNCELMDLNSTYQINDSNTQIKPRNKSIQDTESNFVLAGSKICDKNNSEAVCINSAENLNNHKFTSQPKPPAPPYYTHYIKKPTVLTIEFEKLRSNQTKQNNKKAQKLDNTLTQHTRELLKSKVPENKKIRIISEKKISQPLPSLNKLEPALQVPKQQINDAKTENNSNTNTKYEITEEKNMIMDQQHNEPSTIHSLTKSNNNYISKKNISPKSKSVLKNILPAERLAAIEEKRKFNMKLRDMVETCFDKLDESDKIAHDTRPEENSMRTENVGTIPFQDPELPSGQEYTMTCLEARIKRMEDNLLSRIDQNSNRILDLKKSLLPLSDKTKKTTFTQTFANEESHKKHLYQEISKYLSPEANSLIYEELFINKYSQKVPKNTPSPKRRKRR